MPTFKKISQLPAATQANFTDIMEKSDLQSTPTSQKLTFLQLFGLTFGASGASHSVGAVPDPGGSAGTSRFLREDATWATPAGAVSVNGNFIGQSGSITVVTFTSLAGNNSYEIGGWLRISALSGGQVQVFANYTDPSSNARTINMFGAITGKGTTLGSTFQTNGIAVPLLGMTIRSGASQTISITTTVSASITYDIYAWARLIV